MQSLWLMAWACVFHIIGHAAVLLAPVLFSKQTEGTIVSIDPNDGETFLLTINYSADGRYFQSQHLSKCDIDHIAVGDEVTIKYHSAYPRWAAIQGLGDQPVISEVAFMGGQLCLGLAAMSLVMFPLPIVG